MFIRHAVSIALVALLSARAHAEISKEDLEALQRDRDAAVAKKEITEAEAAQAKARLGSISADLPKGSGEASGLSAEPKILAYRAVDRLAGVIADKVETAMARTRSREARNANGQLVTVQLRPSVVMFSDKDLFAVNQARALRTLMDSLVKQAGEFSVPPLASDSATCALITTSGAGGLPALAAIDVGLQLASLFKTDKKLQGTEVTVDDAAISNAVIGALLGKNIDAARPESFIAGAMAANGYDVISKSAVLASLETLIAKAPSVDLQLAKISDKRDEIKAKAEKEKKPTPQCENAYRRDQVILDNLEAKGKGLKTRVDKLVAATSTVNDAGVSLIQTLSLADAFVTTYADAYVLQIKAVAAGGTVNTKKNLFTTHFLASGGAIVTYQLLDGASGKPVAAGNVSTYGGNIDLDDLTGTVPLVAMAAKP